MYDAVTLGEMLIDFSPAGLSLSGNELFERNPGGAPANVAVALAKLGKKAAFIGKVGRDRFGRFLEETLISHKVDTSGLIFSDHENTTLAFVHLDKSGDRSFSFYRKPGADMMLFENEVDYGLIGNSKIFHFGSVSMTDEPSRTATIKAAAFAKKAGAVVSYDPNIREPLWMCLNDARIFISEGIKYTDILKISKEELFFLTGDFCLEKGSSDIVDKYSVPLIFVTLGREGSFFRFGSKTGYSQAYDVDTIDTTGAGDAFVGGILCRFAESGCDICDLDPTQIFDFMDFANAAGSLATAKRGGIPAMPAFDEVIKCMGSGHKIRTIK